MKKVIAAAKWGFPFTRYDIQLVVKAYLDKKGCQNPCFVNNIPGVQWCRSFFQRHKECLSERLAENIKRARAKLDRETMTKFFENLKVSLEGFDPKLIINFDETNMTDDPGKTRVIVKRGIKYPEKIMDSTKTSVSVMFTGTASGVLLPCYVVYKAEHLYDTWQMGGPAKCRYNRSKSGWFDGTIFQDYFEKIILPYVKKYPGEPAVVLCDNLASHKAYHIVELCMNHNIRFVLLPPNSTHLCQPLDVAYFRPIKRLWRKVLSDWKQKKRGAIPKDQFPGLLKKVIDKLGPNSEENLKSGFRACGMEPFNPEAVIKRIPQVPDDEDNNERSWDSTFEEFLMNRRQEACATGTVRKKRVDIAPGKSACLEDFFSESEEEVDEVSEISVESEEITDESSEESQVENHLSSSDRIEVTVDNFLLIHITYDQGTRKEKKKKFICQVMSVNSRRKNGDVLRCKFLRNNKGSADTYIFPPIDDIDYVSFSQIERVLSVYSNSRGRYRFNE